VDIEAYLAMQAGRAIGNAFGAHMVTGTGTSQPRGVVVDATLGKTGGAGVVGAFTADDLIDLHYSVIAPYRASASCYWIMKDSTLATARKLKDTTGQYLWQPSLQAGAPDMFLGKAAADRPERRRHRTIQQERPVRRLQPVFRAAGWWREIRAKRRLRILDRSRHLPVPAAWRRGPRRFDWGYQVLRR